MWVFPMADEALPARIKSQLDQDETVLWIGGPSQKLFIFTGIDIVAIPFGLIFLFAALMFQGHAIGSGEAFPFFFVMPHLAIGIQISIGRFFVSRHYRRATTYLLTNKRAFIISTALGGRLIQRPVTKYTTIDYTEGEESTIALDPGELSRFNRQFDMIWPTHLSGFQFFHISEGPYVMKLLRQVQLAPSVQ